jgi:hypothetical protein
MRKASQSNDIIYETDDEDNPHHKDTTMLNDSDIVQTELPKILIRATSRFKRSLGNLKTDEYGDLIIKPNDANDMSS